MDLRVGQGFDIHRFVAGRPLRLAGLVIPFDRGLLGHSDGDAVLHALCDALLGALAAGDIGQHFPDDDPRFAGAESSALLAHVAKLVEERGFEVVNVDVTIHAERPKMAPHVSAMRGRIAALLGIDVGAVSVKAKTNEGLDAIGRGEALAATAVALVRCTA